MKKIVLASSSPRRKQLLEWAEIDFDIIVASINESFPDGLPPDQAAMHVAKQKAMTVREGMAFKQYDLQTFVLAADTMVVCENEIIGKPQNREDAIGILNFLSGKNHQVITGVAIINDRREKVFAHSTEVRFYKLTQEQIEFYIDRYKPYDKAGAYAIQEWIGVVGIESIKGDFYNVMGLPVSRVVRELGGSQI